LSSTANREAFLLEPFVICSEKFLSNVTWFPKSEGCTKSIKAHKSTNLFWTGVPVRMNRDRALTLLKAFPTWQDGFLM